MIFQDSIIVSSPNTMNKNHYYITTSYIHCNIDSNYIVITITEYQTCRCHSSIHHYHQTSITSNPTVQHHHLTHIHPHRTQTNSHPLPPLKGNSSPTAMILLGLAPPTTTISPHHYTRQTQTHLLQPISNYSLKTLSQTQISVLFIQ